MIREGVLPGGRTQQLHALTERGRAHIVRMDIATRVFIVVALTLVALSIVFMCLSLYDYIHPLAAICTFGAIIPTLTIAGIISCCRRPVARHFHFPLDRYDQMENDRRTQEVRASRRVVEEDEAEDQSEELSHN